MPKRSAIAISKSKVDNLIGGQQLWDSRVIGFGVVANKNSKTFKFKYYFHGRQRMLTIGVYGSPYTVEAARDRATEALVQLKNGIDPAAARIQIGLTIAELCDEYMQKHANINKKPSSSHLDATNIKNHVKPLLGKLRIADVNSNDIERFKNDVSVGKTAPSNPKAVQKAQKGGKPVKGGKSVGNRCLALMSKMFNLSELWGYRPQNSNPVRGITKFKEYAKERYLTEEELKRLWQHLDNMEEDGIFINNEGEGSEAAREEEKASYALYSVACIRLLILTGARVSEIRELKWDYVDLKGKKLNLPDSKTGRKTIQLSDNAVDVLRALPRVKDNPYVIVGGKTGKPLQNLRKPWVQICKETGLNDVRIHDLRHSFASFAAAQGQPLLVIGKLLGHKNPTTTQRYVHLTESHLGAANQAVTDSIGGIVGGKKIKESS
jgi:integrase